MSSFPKSARLLRRQQYQQLSKLGKQSVGRYLIVEKLYAHSRMEPGPKLGITVSRQYGKAHLRNRFKRIVRECFRKIYPNLPKELYVNVRPRNYAITAASHEITKELTNLLSL